jgi:hypothetical protein
VRLAPTMQFTGEIPWDPITLDLYPAAGQSINTQLYEDDGISNAYETGGFRKTKLSALADKEMKQLHVSIEPASGTFDGASTDRAWRVRVHLRGGMKPSNVSLDGEAVKSTQIPEDSSAMPFAVEGGSPDGPVLEVNLPSKPVSVKRELSMILGN